MGERRDRIPAGIRQSPTMIVKSTALTHNINVMARLVEKHHVLLAPHAKTTMVKEILRRQLEAGAWGLTVASTSQAAVACDVGARNIIVANEIVDDNEVNEVCGLLAGQAVSIFSLVDSVEGVHRLDECCRKNHMPQRLPVLLEIGVEGGRCGVREPEKALEVAEAVEESNYLSLHGVEGFEGVIGADRSHETIAKVDAYLTKLKTISATLRRSRSHQSNALWLESAGGSRYFDRVIALLKQQPYRAVSDAGVVLRSGCYVTHDDGIYSKTTPFGQEVGYDDILIPAIEVWGRVVSTPEPGLTIVGMGRRHMSYDSGLPRLKLVYKSGPFVTEATGWRVRGLDDQHCYLVATSHAATRLEIGDLVGFGISHPCTTFDKWRKIVLVNDDYDILGTYGVEL